MADKWQAQYSFWNSFTRTVNGQTVSVPAYEENSVPTWRDVTFPYITYQAVNAPFVRDTTVSASIWTRSTSWAEADELANQIEARLKNGGVTQGYTGGLIWFSAASPFAQNMGDPSDDLIKRKLLQVALHFC